MNPTKKFQMQLVQEIIAANAACSYATPATTAEQEISQVSKHTVWRAPPERPSPSSPWQYYTKTVSGKEMDIYCRRPFSHENGESKTQKCAGNDKEQELLDPNDLIGTNLFLGIGSIALSRDATERMHGGMIAFTVDTTADDNYAVWFKDIASGRLLPHLSIASACAIEWGTCGTADSSRDVLYYTVPDHLMRPSKVVRRTFPHGYPIESTHNPREHKCFTEEIVFEESDPSMYVDLCKTKDKRFIVLKSNSKNSSEVRLIPTHVEGAVATAWVVHPRQQGLIYVVERAGDQLYMLRNQHARAGGAFELQCSNLLIAKNGKILEGKESRSWTTLLPPTDGVATEDMDVMQVRDFSCCHESLSQRITHPPGNLPSFQPRMHASRATAWCMNDIVAGPGRSSCFLNIAKMEINITTQHKQWRLTLRR